MANLPLQRRPDRCLLAPAVQHQVDPSHPLRETVHRTAAQQPQAWAQAAPAEEPFPSRAIRLVVPMAAGGSTDYSFRTRFVLVCASLGSF